MILGGGGLLFVWGEADYQTSWIGLPNYVLPNKSQFYQTQITEQSVIVRDFVQNLPNNLYPRYRTQKFALAMLLVVDCAGIPN